VTRPQVLVVRSGSRSFLSENASLRVEIIEKVSHAIEPILRGEEALSEPADLTVFTSQIAVERIFGDERLAGLFRKAMSLGRVAAVGPATAKALARNGAAPDLIGSGSVQSLLALLPREIPDSRVLLPRGEDAGAKLPEELTRRGATIACLELYRKVPNPTDSDLEREILARPFAVFCATSPSAARWLFSGLGDGAAVNLRVTPAVALGMATRRELEAHGVQRVEEPRRSTFAGARRLLERLAAEGVRA